MRQMIACLYLLEKPLDIVWIITFETLLVISWYIEHLFTIYCETIISH